MLAAVRRYHEIGWVVHPCCPPDHSCDCPGKIPYDAVGGHHMKDWQNHAQFTLEQWDYFLKCEPNINIGVLCGSPSSILLVDIDNKEAKDAFVRLQRKGDGHDDSFRSKAWRFTTGKGERYIFLSSGECSSYKIPTGTGHYIEILGDGRQSVVPPSLHPTGRRYRWSRGATPRDYRATEKPDFLSEQTTGGSGNESLVDSERNDWVEILSKGVTEGDRNNTMTRVCGRLMCGTPLTESEAWFWFNLYNQHHVSPPMSEAELRKIFNSIRRREESGESRILEIMAEYGVSRRHAETILESMGE